MFLTNLVKGALQRELNEFFQAQRRSDVSECVITKSAFCAARKKLKPSAFVELSNHLLRYWYRMAHVKRWNGLDLRSVDGTTLRLPDIQEIIDRFGQMEPANGRPVTMARVSHLYDPLNSLVHDAVIEPYHLDERSLLVKHLTALTPGCLLLLDAGYPAFWLFMLFHERKIDWCVRMPLDGWSVVRAFLAAGHEDRIVTLNPTATQRIECGERGTIAKPLRVRLVRVLLSTGEVEVLMTSLLDSEVYPATAFGDLYYLRWGHEEHYKRFKSRLEVERWSGRTLLSIYQDFYAKVFTLNLTMALTNSAQKIVDVIHSDEKHPKQVNVTNAICTMKNAFARMINSINLERFLQTLINTFARIVEPVRPLRAYPRNMGVRLHGYHTCYKPCT